MHAHFLLSHIHLNTCNSAIQGNLNCMQRCTLKSHVNMHPRLHHIYMQQCHTGYIPTHMQWRKTCKSSSACNGAIQGNLNCMQRCTLKSYANMHPRLYHIYKQCHTGYISTHMQWCKTCKSRSACNGAIKANSSNHLHQCIPKNSNNNMHIFLRSCVYGLHQYVHMKNSFLLCVLYSAVL